MGRYKWPGDFGAQTQTKMVTDAAYCKVTDVFYPDSSHPGFLTHILPKFPDSIWGFQDVLFQKKAMSPEVKDYKDDDIPLGLLALY